MTPNLRAAPRTRSSKTGVRGSGHAQTAPRLSPNARDVAAPVPPNAAITCALVNMASSLVDSTENSKRDGGPQPGDEVLLQSRTDAVQLAKLLYERDGRLYLQSVSDPARTWAIERAELARVEYVSGMVKSRAWQSPAE